MLNSNVVSMRANAPVTVTALFVRWESIFEKMESDDRIEPAALAVLAAEFMAYEVAIAGVAVATRRETLMKLLVIARGGDIDGRTAASTLLASAIWDLEREAPPDVTLAIAA